MALWNYGNVIKRSKVAKLACFGIITKPNDQSKPYICMKMLHLSSFDCRAQKYICRGYYFLADESFMSTMRLSRDLWLQHVTYRRREERYCRESIWKHCEIVFIAKTIVCSWYVYWHHTILMYYFEATIPHSPHCV